MHMTLVNLGLAFATGSRTGSIVAGLCASAIFIFFTDDSVATAIHTYEMQMKMAYRFPVSFVSLFSVSHTDTNKLQNK